MPSSREASQIVVPSVLIRDYLCRNYGVNKDSVLVVSNGANPEFSRPMDKVECRNQLGFSLLCRVPREEFDAVFLHQPVCCGWQGVLEARY